MSVSEQSACGDTYQLDDPDAHECACIIAPRHPDVIDHLCGCGETWMWTSPEHVPPEPRPGAECNTDGSITAGSDMREHTGVRYQGTGGFICRDCWASWDSDKSNYTTFMEPPSADHHVYLTQRQFEDVQAIVGDVLQAPLFGQYRRLSIREAARRLKELEP